MCTTVSSAMKFPTLSHMFYTHLATRELSFLFILPLSISQNKSSQYSFRMTLSLHLPHRPGVLQTTLPHPGEAPRPCGETGKRIMKKSGWSLPPRPRKAQREMTEKERKQSQERLGLEGTLEHFRGELSGRAGTSCGVELWIVDSR